MKKITILLSAVVMTLLVSCGPGKNDAVKYNDKIMDVLNNLTVYHNGFLNQIDGHNIDSLKMAQKIFSEKSKSSLEEVGKIGPFAEKTEYIDVATEYFKTLNSIADGEGKQMVDIMSKDSTQITEADIAKISELAGAFDSRYEKVFNSMEAAQLAFSKEWKFEIENTKK